MSDEEEFSWHEAEKELMAEIDTSIPHSARIWNYWMGGKDNYPVDQEAGAQFTATYSSIADMARCSRYYIARVVRHLASEAGIRQFLDIGTGLPSHDSTHEIAQGVAPESRIVYVDNDPLVLAHAHALLKGRGTGGTDYIDADLNEPQSILDIARTKLDFEQPIALMLMAVLGHMPITDDDARARGIVQQLKDALPPGSYIALYDGTDTDTSFVDAVDGYNSGGSLPYFLRSPRQLERLMDGFAILDPGVVQIDQWRPDPDPDPVKSQDAWGGVARKP